MDKEDFYYNLRTHLFIEMYFRERKMPLVESTMDKNALYESYGFNQECANTVREILKNINTGTNVSEINIGNSFVDKIVLYFTKNVSSAGYVPNRSVVGKDGRFSEITILVNPFSINQNTLKVSLMHEITHAFQDYNLRQKGVSLSGQINKRFDYGKLTDEYINSDDYHIRYLSKILYLLNGYERGAFFSELKMSLKGRWFDTIEEVMQQIRNTDAYYQFERVIEVSKEIASRFDYGYVNAANKIMGTNFRTPNQFSKWLLNMVYKVEKKLERLIPKIAAEYAKMYETMIPRDVIRFD